MLPLSRVILRRFAAGFASRFGKQTPCKYTSRSFVTSWYNNNQKWSTVSKQFLVNRIEGATVQDDRLRIQWENGDQTEFHNVWLRDHCRCPKCFSHERNSREFNVLSMPLDIKPEKAATMSDGQKLHLMWPDGHNTIYDAEWLQNHAFKTKPRTENGRLVEPFIWNRDCLDTTGIPQKRFKSVIEDDKSCFELSYDIKKFGFALVDKMPSSAKAIEDLAERLTGFVQVSAIGGVWEFSNGSDPNNALLSYTAAKMEAHTDFPFYSFPSGLVIMQCIHQEGIGGENFLIDGFKVAEMLKEQDIDAFRFLSSKRIPYHLKSKTGYHLKADGPVIELDSWNNVKQIRYNLFSRDVLDCLDADDVPKFYQAFQSMSRIVHDPENAIWITLEPNVCLIMDTWRTMHGQNAFTGVRKLLGCHCSKDDFESRFRYNYDRFL